MSKIRAQFAIDVTANTGQARADIERFKSAQSRSNIGLGIDVGLAQAQADMERFRQRQGRDGLAVKVDLQDGEARAKLDELRARQRAQNIKVKVTADAGGALKAIESLDDQLGSILGTLGKGLKLNLSIAGIGELPAASLAIADVAGAIQQLAQAGLAIPGILAGVVASVGTLAFGVSGVKEAYSAVTKASDDAGKNQTRSANTAARAQRELNDAYRDAKQQIEDLNLAARGDQISQQEAIVNAGKARRQLQRDIASGSIKDQLDLQSDLLDIQSADQRVAETAQRNIENQDKLNRVNAAGVEGNERVVSAHEAVADAAAASGSEVDAAAQKMAKLAPNAKEFAQTLVDLRPVFQDLQKDAANPIFDGLGKSLKGLVDGDLPTLKKGLVGIGTAWNGTLKQLLGSLGSDSSKGFLDRILGNTADAQTRAQQAIDPIVHALGTLTAAGSDALPRLADGFNRLATRFDAFITEADKDGSLQRWISEGLTAVSNLGDTILNLGKSFTAVTRALGGGEGLLGLLDKGSKKLADFLNSTEGQNKLKQWFEEGRREIQEHIIPLLQSLPGFFEGLYTAGRTIADTVIPPLRDISKFLSEHPRLIKDVVIAFAAWKTISGVSSLISDLDKISNLLGSSGTKGKKGKAGFGGKGILGKLGLITGGALLLDGVVNDDGDPAPTQTPATTAPSAIPSDQLPVGQSVPFAQTPGLGLTPQGVAPVVAGATSGALLGGPAGAVAGAAAAVPGAVSDNAGGGVPTGPEADFNTIVDSIPKLNDTNLKTVADMFHVSPDQLKSMTRSQLHDLWVAAEQGKTPPPTDPTHGLLLPGYVSGGPTPSGRGNGPTGGHVIEAHGDEFVISARGRASVPDSFLYDLNKGKVPAFDNGGLVDTWGNPVNPGGQPGPAAAAQPVAPNPLGGGGIGSILSNVLSSTQSTIGNIAGLAQAGAGAAGTGSAVDPNTTVHGAGAGAAPGPVGGVALPDPATTFATRLAGIPGIAGAIGASMSPNPDAALMSWGTKTSEYVAKWGMDTLGKVGSTLWSGALGFFGLQDSILSPNNPYFQSAQKTGQFFMGQDGPIGSLLGMGGGGKDAPYAGDSNTIGAQTITLSDGTQIQVPTYGSSVTPTGPTDGGATVGPSSSITPIIGSSQAPVPGAIWYPALKKWMKDGAVVGTTPPSGAGGGGGAESWRPAVRAAIATYGPRLGITNVQAWENALVRQIQTESGGNPGADNPNDTNGRGGSQHVSGLLQFLPGTFSSNNISGGQYLDPNAQIAAALQYVMSKYGVGSDGSPNQIGRGVGYYSGGPTPSWAGPLDARGGHLAVVHPDEFMISKRGRATVPDSFLHALNQGMVDPKTLSGYYDGGPTLGVPQPSPRPNFQVPNAQTKVVPPPVHSTAPAQVAPSAPVAPAPPPAPSTSAPATVQQPQQQTYAPGMTATAPNPTAGGSGMMNHNLAAVDTLIKSGAATAATIASTAISMAGSLGGGGGGMGAGALGQFVGGAIQEGGKVVDQIANVVSSSLVGSVPGSMGAPGARAYGQQLHAQQNAPVTAPVSVDTRGGDTYNFNGHSTSDVMDLLNIERAKEAQARNAKYGG